MLIFALKEEPTDWNADSDLLKNFLECDSETRLNILLNHPQVEGVIFVKNNFLYFSKSKDLPPPRRSQVSADSTKNDQS